MKTIYLKNVGFCLIVIWLCSCGSGKQKNVVFKDAVAVWHMADLNDSTVQNSKLVALGDVMTGIQLTGEEKEASLKRGGDGYIAKLNGGWLNADQGIDNELTLKGTEATFAIRVHDPLGKLIGPLLGKHGTDTRIAYRIYADTVQGGGVILGTDLGSDEITGMHRMKTSLQGSELKNWHDIIVRFNGKTSEFFLDGNLVDDEITVGTLRTNNHEPFLIGAEYFEISGSRFSGEAPQEDKSIASEKPNYVFDDFESDNYKQWKVEGKAFQKKPSRMGELRHLDRILGIQGNFLADSYLEKNNETTIDKNGGDHATGKLTSLPFIVDHRYLSFLIAGGNQNGLTSFNLVVEGKIIRSETGTRRSRTLMPYRWDLKEIEGKKAQLEIVDADTSLGGKIMVDQIIFTDNPVKSKFFGEVDHAALWNRALSDAEIAKLSGVTRLGDKRPKYYSEKYRPQFHFTPKKSWMNDPNGLVYYNGTYHMCYQHMPPGRPGANKDWGQAISTDLVHWKQLPSALTPHKIWGGCWSGSAVVDWQNTTGFQSGKEKPIIAILTNGGVPGVGAPCTQCIAYSVDGGMTFTYYDKNPVLGHVIGENRDPKVVWFAPTKKWILALYLSGNDYGLFASPDMKSWEHICTLTLPGVSECPDFFEIPVDGNALNKKWVFWGASGNYLIGTFDGQTFKTESNLLKADYGKNFYAAQTWSDIPEADGRRIQIAWMAGGKFPGMPFEHQMNFPTEVTLRTTPEGIRMYRLPVKEINILHDKDYKWSNVTLNPGDNIFSALSGELFEIRAEIEPGNASSFDVIVRGEKIHYNVKDQTISCLDRSTPLSLENGRIKLQILVDRTSLEVFANNGRIVMTSCFLPPDDNKKLEISTESAPIRIISSEVYSLKSIWQ